MSHTAEEDRAYFQNVIAAKNEIWLAEAAGRLVGFLAGTDGYVDRLYVAVDRQRQGIGTSLLALAKEQWPTGLRLHTHQKNVEACHFYEKEGFEVARQGGSVPHRRANPTSSTAGRRDHSSEDASSSSGSNGRDSSPTNSNGGVGKTNRASAVPFGGCTTAPAPPPHP